MIRPTAQCVVVLQSRGQGQQKINAIGQSGLLISRRIMILPHESENIDALKRWSCIFPTTLTYIFMLDNCLNNILMLGCSLILGEQILIFVEIL